jgi:uncharacterized membrane protein YfcA
MRSSGTDGETALSFEHFRIGFPVSGLLIGLLVGLTGVGGGSLMTPMLILVFGMRALNAVGVDLLFAAVTKTFGTMVHGKMRTVEWPVVWWMLAGSLPMTVVTLLALRLLGPTSAAVNHTATVTIGVALIITAVSVVLRPQVTSLSQRYFGHWASRRSKALTVVLGAVLGVLVPITSVGAAALGMPVLLLLYPRVVSSRLVGADIAHAVPLTLVAGMGHLFVRTIDPVLLLSLLAGSVPGVILGSFASGRIPDRLLRYVLSMALVLAGWKLIA